MGLKSTISKRQLLLACAAISIISFASEAKAGFEWVPKQQPKINAADMVVQDAPVAPVAGEALAQEQQIMMPAPNSGMIIPENNADLDASAEMAIQDTAPIEEPAPTAGMKTMSFTQPQNEMIAPEEQVILPPPTSHNQQAQAISVQELEQSETQIDLPTNPAPQVIADQQPESNEPINLMDQDNSMNAPADISVPDAAPVEAPMINQAQTDTMIEPFPVQAPGTATNSYVPVAQTAPAMQPSMGSMEVVHGFGKNMPLALAVQQIVPEGYAYSFGKNVNIGQRVEWNGGQSWDVVLRETLLPVNLDAYFDGNKVVVYNSAMPIDKMSSAEPAEPAIETIAQAEISAPPAMDASAAVAAVEPAAGSEIIDAETVTLARAQTSTIPTKRSTIQDPGDVTLSPITEPVAEADVNVDIQSAAATDMPKWDAAKGESLKSVLYSWSEKSNMQVIWEASHDFTLEENFSYQGSSKDAFKTLLEAQKMNGKDIYVRYVDNPQNPSNLAMIIVQDNEQAMQKQQEADQKNAG